MKTLNLISLIMVFMIQPRMTIASAEKTYKLNQTIVNKIDQYLSGSIENGFSGAVLISEKNVKHINKGYGLADKEKNKPNEVQTVFDIGSNTKQFTAVAILLLVQQGQLNLTDPVSLFFKDTTQDKHAITIHQLLIHTSGLIEAIGGDFDVITEVDFFDQVFASELLFPIGSKYAYSNIGYSLLAKIIEITSGQSYESYLHQNLFLPIGMLNTGYIIPDWQQQNLAKGYSRGVMNQGSMVERYQKHNAVTWHLKGNGGINSTQEDMFLWIEALKSNSILTAENFELLTSGHSSIFDGFNYGYGWGINQSLDHTKRISHNGSNGSFAHNITWFPMEDILILFSSNAASPITEKMAKTIEKIIFQPDFITAPIKKNPYFLVFNFVKEKQHNEAEKLLDLIKIQYLKDFSNPDILNRIGYNLLREQQLPWAIEVFKINTELFIEDSNVWDSLGDAYLANNQRVQAISSFEKAIELGGKVSSKKLAQLSH